MEIGNLCITKGFNGKYLLKSCFHYFGIANAIANSIANAQCERTLQRVRVLDGMNLFGTFSYTFSLFFDIPNHK